MVKLLIQEGADVNARDDEGEYDTPRHPLPRRINC